MSFKNSRIIRNILLLMANEIPNMSNSDLRNVALVNLQYYYNFSLCGFDRCASLSLYYGENINVI